MGEGGQKVEWIEGRLDVVVPVFNEEQTIPRLVEQFDEVRRSLPAGLAITLHVVNDGSCDRSGQLLDEAAAGRHWYDVIHLSRNFGHQAAVTAGLDRSDGDFVCIIDGDLQDPPELIVDMLDVLVRERCDVVYGQRTYRHGETRFKRWTAAAFYRLMRRASGIEIPLDTGDFRVMSRRMHQQLRSLPEHHRFLRAMIPWIGLPSRPFPYERQARVAGETKYSFGKMFNLAAHAMASFSAAPIRFMQVLGTLLIALGAAVTAATTAVLLTSDHPVGVAFLAGVVMFTGGATTTAVAIVGGYVFRVQDEVKARPLYVIDRTSGDGVAAARLAAEQRCDQETSFGYPGRGDSIPEVVIDLEDGRAGVDFKS